MGKTFPGLVISKYGREITLDNLHFLKVLGSIIVSVLIVASGTSCIASGSAPELLSPANGDTISDTILELTWTTVENASQYRVQIDNDSFFMSPAIDQSDLEATTFKVKTGLNSQLEGGIIYFWRASAYNKDQGNWSEIRQFYNLRPNDP